MVKTDLVFCMGVGSVIFFICISTYYRFSRCLQGVSLPGFLDGYPPARFLVFYSV